MPRVLCVALAALGSLAACANEPKEAVAEVSATSLRTQFHDYCDWSSRGAPADLALAPWIGSGDGDAPPAPVLPREGTLELYATATGLRFHPRSELAWDAPDLDGKLATALFSTQRDTSRDPEDKSGVRWRLVATADTKAVAIARLLDRLVLAGYPRGSVALAYDTSSVPDAPDPTLGAELGRQVLALPSEERARWFSEQLTPAQEACPAISVALREVALLEQSERCKTLADSAAAALAQCPALLKDGEPTQTLLWMLMGGGATQGMVVVDTTVDWTVAPQRFAPEATWGDLAKAAITDGKPKVLRLAPEGSDAAPSWIEPEVLKRQCVDGQGLHGSAPYRACMHLCLTGADAIACARSIPAFRTETARRQAWLGWLCEARTQAKACRELAELHPKGSPDARSALDKGLVIARGQCNDIKAPNRKEACVEVFLLLGEGGADDKTMRAGMQAACDVGDERSCQVMKTDYGR